MKFGSVPVRDATGARRALGAHRERLVKKGTRIGAAEVAALQRAGIKEIVVARLEDGDVPEDTAAAEL